MTSRQKLFPVTMVGSWPRPPDVMRALRQKHEGTLSEAAFNQVADEAVVEALRAQEASGLDLVTDGEQRRDNFYSFVAEKMDGVRLTTLAEMLNIVEDKARFERILQTLDVPAFSMKTAMCVGKVRRRSPLALDDYRFLRAHTRSPIKVTLPGPYLLTRSMWVKEVSRDAYHTKEDLGKDVVRILREEVQALKNGGADFIQFDEPVLTELVFTQGQTLTFMCAALAARRDPSEELEFATQLMNQVTKGTSGVRIGVHICRGNWSQNEKVLLSGSYRPLASYLERMNVDQFVLEFATPRAGGLEAIGDVLDGKELGLGVVNPRISEVETPQQIVRRAKEAMLYVPAERLFLNPDCGFGTFAQRPLNTARIAAAKLASISQAASILRA